MKWGNLYPNRIFRIIKDLIASFVDVHWLDLTDMKLNQLRTASDSKRWEIFCSITITAINYHHHQSNAEMNLPWSVTSRLRIIQLVKSVPEIEFKLSRQLLHSFELLVSNRMNWSSWSSLLMIESLQFQISVSTFRLISIINHWWLIDIGLNLVLNRHSISTS